MGNRTRLAIVGFWEGNRDKAPFSDPTFDIFGINHLHPYIPRWDLWIDMHTPAWSAEHVAEIWSDQDKFLRTDHGKPVYMLDKYPEYPSSIAYPRDEIMKRFGRSYFTNGIAYMVALALYLGHYKEIQMWGVDMRHNEEYALQRPCTEFWLGIAQGMGIKVVIPESAALLSADHFYGYEEEGGIVAEAIKAHQAVIKDATKKRDEALAHAQTFDGVIQDNVEWIRRWDQRSRGGIL